MTSEDYWLECLAEALDNVGCYDLIPREKQKEIAKDLLIGHDMFGTAFGHDCIPNPEIAEINNLKLQRKKDKEENDHEIRLYEEALRKALKIPKGTHWHLNSWGEIEIF